MRRKVCATLYRVSNYVFIESQYSLVSEPAVALRKEGHTVTVFLVQNGVLAALKLAGESQVPAIVESGVTVLADDFSMQERGISMDECAPGLQEGTMDRLIDLIVQDNTKAIWH